MAGRNKNFTRELPIQSRSELTSVSRTIVDILYTAFDYRGTADLNANLAYRRAPSCVRCRHPSRRKT